MTISRRALLAAGAGAGLLTACGFNTGRADNAGAGPTLSQWYHQYGETGTEQAVERYAAAYKKAKVSVQWRPGNYDQQTAAALLTDSGPDVFEGGPTLDQIQSGQVVDLTDLLQGVKDDFNPAVLTPKTYDGRIWGIPQVIDMQLLYYRKSLLSDAGVEPPDTRIGQDRNAWTVQVALSSFTTSQVVRLHELFVAAAVSILPLLVVFLCFQRWIVAGVERSGID